MDEVVADYAGELIESKDLMNPLDLGGFSVPSIAVVMEELWYTKCDVHSDYSVPFTRAKR